MLDEVYVEDSDILLIQKLAMFSKLNGRKKLQITKYLWKYL